MEQPNLFPTGDAGNPGMDDFLACSDLCEENRFTRQAAILRAMAGAGGKVYVVAERDVDYNDENLYLRDHDGQPQSLFLDRAEAERAASLRNAERLRAIPLLEYGNRLSDFTTLTESELNRGVGAILGIEFDLWSCDKSEFPFPSSATDEQMAEVADLFDLLYFYHVIEAEFGG
jgi:hypothetical protein